MVDFKLVRWFEQKHIHLSNDAVWGYFPCLFLLFGTILLTTGNVKNFSWWFGLLGNKANLRDLIAATGLVILLKLDSNLRFFSPCDLEIWWMTPKNNRPPLLCYCMLFVSSCSHWWIETGFTVWKRLIWVKIDNFFAVWPCSLTDDLGKQ